MQTQIFRKYDSIIIKWLDTNLMYSLNLTYQLQNWIHSHLFQWFQLKKWKHKKFLWKSKDTYRLLSGFNVEWKIDVVSYLNFYMNNVYSSNPYLTSVFINHKSKLYTSQSIKLLSGYSELFGFQSEQQIDLNLYINNSVKLVVDGNNLSMEILSNPWPNNFNLFTYKRNDYLIQNKKFYVDKLDNPLTIFDQCSTITTTTTLKPFNWFHLNIKKVSNSKNAYSIIEINLIKINGIFIKFNYLSIKTNHNNASITTMNFFIHQLTALNIQEDYQLKQTVVQLNIQLNNMNNILQFIEIRLINFLENSAYLQINTTRCGIIQAISYLNEYEILKANGSIDILGDNTTNAFVQIYHPFNTVDIIFHKYINSRFLLQVTSQSDYYPFQLNLINDMPNCTSCNTSVMNALNTSLYINIFNLFKITWRLHYNSTEDSFLSMYYSQMLFNITIFQDFLFYQTSVEWNEILSDKTSHNENEKNITIDTKVQSSKSNYTNFQCTINIFKTKAFLTPVYGQPSQFRIYIGFLYLNNNDNPHEILLITNYENNTQQLGKVTTILNSSVADDKYHFYVNNELEWKLTHIGELQKLHSNNYIYFKPRNQSIKIILLHDINNQLLSSILIEYIDQYHQKVYSLKSWLQPLHNLHEITLQWPNLHTIQLATIYNLISLNSYIGLTLDHLVYFNYDKYLHIKNQVIFKLGKQKLIISHYIKKITTTNTTELINNNNNSSTSKNNDIISQFHLIIQLYHNIQLLPFNIQLIYKYKLYLYLSIYNINKNFVGKLKVDLTKDIGDTLFELLSLEYENLQKFNVTLNLNYSFSIRQSMINAIVLMNTALIKQNQIIFNWKLLDNRQFLNLKCNILSLCNFIYHFKHRWHSLYYFDGSNMLSIQSINSRSWFTGFYLNNNYVLQLTNNYNLLELHTEYSISNSLGPGTPLRIKLLYKHNENYEHGNLEVSLDSQLIGYYIGFEMMNTMIEYEYNTMNIINQINFISRCIIGYRLYEGRGTKGYQSELFISQNKNNQKLDILFKIGQSGLLHQNTIEYSHSLQRQNVFIQFSTVYSGNPFIETKLDVQFQNNSLLPIRTNIYLIVTWLPLVFIIDEELQVNKSTSITYDNFFISLNKSSIFDYFNQSLLLENKSIQSTNMYKYMRLHRNTNVLRNHFGEIPYKKLHNFMNTAPYEYILGH
ncbi:hypothetical protein MN116_001824 [Schistosoma mekongi]|uniref:Uncharacterized protein n=1 Tax=Schistosoma mekongi TaxID=38744 RepID=A0AAE1ZI52_SCHME|nr:hypothetical protein MN116_001824 [Schistosoma mekongi]